MGTVVVNSDTSLTPPTLFGCAFRSLSIQLGFNNNPTTFSTTVVRDIGQTFSLKTLADQGIYSMQNIQLGSIDEWVVVESWEESEVDIAGSGTFAVKLSDARSVLESVNIITGPLNVDAFTATRPNILAVKELDVDSLQTALDGKIFTFRGQNFQVNIDEFIGLDVSSNVTEPRTGGGGGLGGFTPSPVDCPGSTSRSEYKGVAGGGQTVITETDFSDTNLQRSIDFQIKLLAGKPAGERLRIQRKIDQLEATLLRQQVLNRTSNVVPGLFTGLQLTDSGADDASDANPIRGATGSTTPSQPIQITLTLKDIINQLAETIGSIDWFVSTSRSGDIFTITIKLIKRSLATDVATDISIIASQHADKIIKKRIGTENNPNSGKTSVLFGGLKKTLTEFGSTSIKQFWGFDESGKPFTVPTIKITTGAFETTEDLLSQSLTNEFALLSSTERTIPFTREDMNLIKNYSDEFWGRQFYIEIDGEDIDTDGATLINVIRKAWFESDLTPGGVGEDIQDKFRFSDGRWPTIVKTPQKNVWSDSTLRNNSTLLVSPSTLYLSAEARIENEFIIIRLLVPPTFKDIESGFFQKKRVSTLQKAWVGIENTRERYGPWSNDESNDISFDGFTDLQIDDTLTPWRFRIKNLTNTAALESLDNFAIERLGFAQPQSRTLKTITLEVADLPKFNIGQLFQGGSAINSMSIQFSTSRITTTYTAKTFTLNLQQKIANTVSSNSVRTKDDRLEKDCDEDNNRAEEKEILSDPPGVISDIPEEFNEEEEIFENELSPPIANWLYRNGVQKAGIGVIIGPRGGARYDINRLDSEFDFGAIGEWTNVPNLAENEDGTPFLPNGTRVQVQLYDTGRPQPQSDGAAPIGENGGGDTLDTIAGGDVSEAIGNTIKKAMFTKEPGSFQATVIGGGGDGIYNVTREIDGQGFSAQNTAEKDGSPGYVLVGTRVDLNVDDGGVVFFNQTPTVFAVPEN